MKRRDLLLLALASPLARAQRYRTYSRCLPNYLARLARDAYERRNAAIAQLKTPEAIRERQAWVRRTFWQLVGGEPERTPLNLRTTGSFERKGYRVEKLVYESQPGLHIPANLYIPARGTPPFPGVLFQMGHSLNGKAADPYQKCCQGLVQLGYVVLAFDPMGQGERTYYPKPGGTTTRLGSADDEHSVPGKQMLLTGDTATRLQTWDAVRSLDVLAAHPLVDPKRLTSTGQSGGGTLTMMLAAVDDRLAAAAVSSGNTENLACADFNPPGSVDDAEQDFINGGPLGFDRWDTLYPLAPKPLLITVSARDFFGTYSPSYLSSGDEEFRKLRGVYQTLGAGNAIEWLDSPVPHALTPGIRLAIYNFFERRLRGSERAIEEEPPVQPEPEAALYAGASGNVVRDFRSTTPQRIAVARAKSLTQDGTLNDVLNAKMPSPDVAVRRLGATRFGKVGVEAIETPSATGVWVPAWLYLPAPDTPKKPLLLLLEPQGRNARWREDDLYHQLADTGFAVCAFDVRGIGDLSPEVGRGNPYYTKSHSTEEAWAWASMMLGEPLLGQRITDILALAASLRRYSSVEDRPQILAARGGTTVPALLAGILDSQLAAVATVGGLGSWAELVAQEQFEEPFANFLPRALTVTDLPDVRRQLGSRWRELPSWNAKFFALLNL